MSDEAVRHCHSAVPAVYLIMRRGEEVLLMLRQGSGYYDDWWGLPAGHMEEGEIPSVALAREVMEEVGVAVTPQQATCVHVMYRTAADTTGDRCDWFFLADEWEGEPSLCEPHKCQELKWFPVAALPKRTIPYVRQGIEHALRGDVFSEHGSDDVFPSPS